MGSTTRGRVSDLPRVFVWARAAALLALVALPGCGLLPREPVAAERGRRLAERTGCFSCHGPEGRSGSPNPGRDDRTVPDFSDDVMMYAKGPDDLREWIQDGVTRKKAPSATWREQRRRGTLRMPAFRRRLSARQIEDLVAFVQASAGEPAPGDSLAARGLERAKKLGCSGCHGPGGRLERPNPGSLRGLVPAWDSADFPDLVRGRQEFGEWVEHGVSQRFQANPAARYFLERAALHMPAFERHVEPGDVDALWAYVQWLRNPNHPVAAPQGEE